MNVHLVFVKLTVIKKFNKVEPDMAMFGKLWAMGMQLQLLLAKMKLCQKLKSLYKQYFLD